MTGTAPNDPTTTPVNWSDSAVLVTGGTGSFGQAFVRIMLEEYHPRRLVILSRDELKQSEMKAKWPDGPDSPMRYFLGDVRDYQRLLRAMNRVDIVVHTAALKQVPALEANPFEAVQTNIIGSKNLIEAAIDAGVRRTVALSTDKAVNPINLYGATKLVAEKLFVQGNAYSGLGGAIFACARYGNVVGSRGSVIPVFKEQSKNGAVTVTDERMSRFWISLEQGVRFVIRVVEQMRGGEVFVPKIPSMKLTDLVQAVAADCRVEVTGIRPGEKLHEVLISEDESRQVLEFDDYYVILPTYIGWGTPGWTGGKAVPDRFRYASDTNLQRLNVDELARMAEEV